MKALAMESKNSGPEVFDRWGRRFRCLCGRVLRHPATGRPRVHCGRHECALRWLRLQRAAKRTPRYTEADQKEALELWRGTCGACLEVIRITDPWPRFVEGVVPVHVGCAGAELPQLTRTWLARCAPGCPIPNPFAGGRIS